MAGLGESEAIKGPVAAFGAFGGEYVRCDAVAAGRPRRKSNRLRFQPPPRRRTHLCRRVRRLPPPSHARTSPRWYARAQGGLGGLGERERSYRCGG